ncbi:hypothetical protein ACF0H5_005722 [Mactra antiquata]
MIKIVNTISLILYWLFVKKSKTCKKTQEDLLKDILKTNKDTLFFKDHSLSTDISVDEFRRCMPLTTYKDLAKYADMITENGNENVLFPGKASFVAYTSGTSSGKSKAFPKSAKMKMRSMISMLILQTISKWIGIIELKKMVFLRVCAKLFTCKSGIESGPISHLMTADMPFLTVYMKDVYTEYEALYIQLVFALNEDDLVYFSATVSTVALATFRILEKKWASICDDIETGKLSESLNISDEERKRLNALLKPRPERANFLRKEFSKGLSNIVKRCWPSCPLILSVKTGVFESAANIIHSRYLGDLSSVSLLHVGTETLYGINIHPLRETVSYIPIISLNFIEFLPEDEMEQENPQTLLAHQVEVGKTYEVVVTTYEGLYRYRTEDTVQIVEFFHTTPLYKFVGRSGDILSVSMDKVPEFLVHEAVQEAAKTWKHNLVDFTSCESIHVNNITGMDDDFQHYFVLIETDSYDKLTKEHEAMVDEGLCRRHDVYAAMRRNKKIEQLRFIQLKPGTFAHLLQKMLELNPAAFSMQVKLPRILRRENLLKIVLAERL